MDEEMSDVLIAAEASRYTSYKLRDDKTGEEAWIIMDEKTQTFVRDRDKEFIKFESREACQNAIEALNKKYNKK